MEIDRETEQDDAMHCKWLKLCSDEQIGVSCSIHSIIFPSHSSDSQMRSCCSFFHEVPTSELRSFFMNIVSNVGTSLISPVMDVGDATSTTSMDVVNVGLENQVGRES